MKEVLFVKKRLKIMYKKNSRHSNEHRECDFKYPSTLFYSAALRAE